MPASTANSFALSACSKRRFSKTSSNRTPCSYLSFRSAFTPGPGFGGDLQRRLAPLFARADGKPKDVATEVKSSYFSQVTFVFSNPVRVGVAISQGQLKVSQGAIRRR